MRKRIDEIRRSELIEAAHRVFLREGLQGLTTARICKEAGMSPGILAYYFKGKDEVLLGMVRYNNRLLMEDVIAWLGKAQTQWARLGPVAPEIAGPLNERFQRACRRFYDQRRKAS